MWRCLELAKKGKGNVEPNPMVGAILVFQGKIIGEGYHEGFGKPHAEVNAINNAIFQGHESLLPRSTLYVTLEPCSHYGKTPPCADLIIQKKIPRVVIGNTDPNPEVNGNGIKKLGEAGVQVELIEDENCRKAVFTLIKPFAINQSEHRPYVILKWAETADGYIGSGNTDRLMISNEFSNRLVHKWRSEESAIIVGRNTALHDDPTLTNRYWPGKNPLRMVIDPELTLPAHLKLFNGEAPLTIFNYKRSGELNAAVRYVQLGKDLPITRQVMDHLYLNKIPSLIVEGGARLLQSFIEAGTWDEIRIIKSSVKNGGGLKAPNLPEADLFKKIKCGTDHILFYGKP